MNKIYILYKIIKFNNCIKYNNFKILYPGSDKLSAFSLLLILRTCMLHPIVLYILNRVIDLIDCVFVLIEDNKGNNTIIKNNV